MTVTQVQCTKLSDVDQFVTSFRLSERRMLAAGDSIPESLKAELVSRQLERVTELASVVAQWRAEPDPKAAKILDPAARALLGRLAPVFEHADEWQAPVLEARGRAFAEVEEVKFVKIAQPLRAAITGRTVSPGIFQVCQILGREETLRRLRDAVPAP